MGFIKPAQFMESIQNCLSNAGKILSPKQSLERGVAEEMLSVSQNVKDIEKLNTAIKGRANELLHNTGTDKYRDILDEFNIPKDQHLEALASVAKTNGEKINNLTENWNNLHINGLKGADSLTQRGQIVLNAASDYYSPSVNGWGTTAARIGAAAGIYGAGAIGLRYATGGTLTQNANGDNDIAGIPFI